MDGWSERAMNFVNYSILFLFMCVVCCAVCVCVCVCVCHGVCVCVCLSLSLSDPRYVCLSVSTYACMYIRMLLLITYVILCLTFSFLSASIY
jgi:hypothetical protein